MTTHPGLRPKKNKNQIIEPGLYREIDFDTYLTPMRNGQR
jgi:hypothetical protein